MDRVGLGHRRPHREIGQNSPSPGAARPDHDLHLTQHWHIVDRASVCNCCAPYPFVSGATLVRADRDPPLRACYRIWSSKFIRPGDHPMSSVIARDELTPLLEPALLEAAWTTIR